MRVMYFFRPEFLLTIACIFSSVDLVSPSNRMIYRTTKKPASQLQIPDILKKTPDFIEAEGYIAETHQITTEDGYILTAFRVPFSKSMDGAQGAERPAVILQHGIFSASDHWVLDGSRSFPFLLAEHGYDVWLPNSRATTYSMRHVNMTSDDREFWSYSLHEVGIYDLPACIDYILHITGQKKLFYVGHSRGTTTSYVMLSLKPEYNEKIRLLINYGNTVYFTHVHSLFWRLLFSVSPRLLANLGDSIGVYRYRELTNQMAEFQATLCSQKGIDELCTLFLFLTVGFDKTLFNRALDQDRKQPKKVYGTMMKVSDARVVTLNRKTRLPLIYSHYPNNGGLRDLLHVIQLGRTDRFQQYDWDVNNYLFYRSTVPPTYPLEKVTAPTAVYQAPNDAICDDKDVDRLVRELGNVVKYYRVPFKRFTHTDFLWGNGASKLVYEPTIEFMSHY